MKILKKDILDHSLWKRDTYLQDIDYIINSNIYEYDMKNAGYNLAIYYGLLDNKMIDYLEGLTKQDRTIQIGMLMRDNKGFRRNLSEAFSDMRRKFFINNNIQRDQILSIKKDAIFLINTTCDKTKFRNVEFVMKNRYTSFHKFDRIEFFYRNRSREVAVKGIRDEKLEYHKDGMLSFLTDIFHLLETSDNSRVVSKIKKFASMYKKMELPIDFYRELNSGSMFTLTIDSTDTKIQSIDYIQGFGIDHSFNYMMYILRLIQRFFFLK